jgi:hypothetical protein
MTLSPIDIQHRRKPHVGFDGTDVLFGSTDICRIKTGTYTGDGATSLAITGVGFKPKFVFLLERATSDATGVWVGFTTDQVMDDNNAGGSISLETVWSNAGQFRTNEVISLDADGFTVDDDGADAHPNKNSTVYNYMAMG